MRVLIVEDQDEMREFLLDEFEVAGLGVLVDFAHDLAGAQHALASSVYDLIVCDLRIPPTGDSVDADPVHGLAVHAIAREEHSGTPLVFLTGFGTLRNVGPALSQGPMVDLWGAGPAPLVMLFEKDRPREFLQYVEAFAAELSTLEEVKILPEETGIALDEVVRRALQIYARRRNAKLVEVGVLSGLSGAVVLQARFLDERRDLRCRTFAKIGDRRKLLVEQMRYAEYVQGVLPFQRFAPDAGVQLHNLRGFGALFYSLADGFERSLFDIVDTVEPPFAPVVEAVRESLQTWHSRRRKCDGTVGELRRRFLSDERAAGLGVDLAFGADYEREPIRGDVSVQHGDLHCGNVLINDVLEPLLIDFGDVGELPSATDAVTLEFSPIFHKASPFLGGPWPSLDQAERWWDLENYLNGCPFSQLIHACRSWLKGMESDDLAAAVYVHACRQMKYGDVPQELLVAFARGAIHYAREVRR